MDHDAEFDAILEQVEAARLVEQFTDEQGRLAMRLTPDGVRVARQLAMLGEDGQDALLAALLDEPEALAADVRRLLHVSRGLAIS
jgi:hypothetical protein